MAFNAFSSPFWDFFDNINDEVEQFNRLIQSTGLDNRVRVAPSSSKAVTQNGEKSNEVAANSNANSNSNNGTGAVTLPSFFNYPFFDTSFDVVPPVDLLDNEKEYELHVSIPGAKKDDIKLDFHPEKHEIVISGEIPGHSKNGTKNLKVKERASGKFERRITLPTSTKLDEENIKAAYNNGVLTLKVPKASGQEETTKRIEISSSDSWEDVEGDEKE